MPNGRFYQRPQYNNTDRAYAYSLLRGGDWVCIFCDTLCTELRTEEDIEISFIKGIILGGVHKYVYIYVVMKRDKTTKM